MVLIEDILKTEELQVYGKDSTILNKTCKTI
jgi:hypothetical protein